MPDIRPETAADIQAIRAVNVAAFPTPGEAKLVDLLRNAGRLLISLVAVEDGKVVGHVAISPINFNGGVGLAPVAVAPDHQRKGIGKALVQAAINVCRSEAFGFIVVLGEPEFYGRFGFVPASEYNLEDEYGGGDAFQVLPLRDNHLPSQGGRVKFAPEFKSL